MAVIFTVYLCLSKRTKSVYASITRYIWTSMNINVITWVIEWHHSPAVIIHTTAPSRISYSSRQFIFLNFMQNSTQPRQCMCFDFCWTYCIYIVWGFYNAFWSNSGTRWISSGDRDNLPQSSIFIANLAAAIFYKYSSRSSKPSQNFYLLDSDQRFILHVWINLFSACFMDTNITLPSCETRCCGLCKE